MKNNTLKHNPQNAQHIHCIGIGGIGVSAIARLFKEQGKNVTGSDVATSDVTRSLKKIGIIMTIGSHKATSIPKNTEVVIYSPAVSENNTERQEARTRGIIEISYPEMLGHLMKNKEGIAVAGTHGKTTTTALLGHVWVQAHLDPTVIIGSFVKDFDGANERLGKSHYMIVEADEYKSSFLNYKPSTIILTSIDIDHLDYYKDLNHIKAVFQEFILRLPSHGLLVANADDDNIRSILRDDFPFETITYGLTRGDIQAAHIRQTRHGSTFVVKDATSSYDTLTIPLTGLYNISNTLAVYVASRHTGIKNEIIKNALKKFKGTWRRQDFIKKIGSTDIMDDYAHHPTEIRALISSLRQMYPAKKIHMVYQPHQEARFTKLFPLFKDSFDGIDKLTLTEIYQVEGRRSTSDSAQRLATELQTKPFEVTFGKTFPSLAKKIASTASEFDIIAFVGAGDIIELRKKVVTLLT